MRWARRTSTTSRRCAIGPSLFMRWALLRESVCLHGHQNLAVAVHPQPAAFSAHETPLEDAPSYS